MIMPILLPVWHTFVYKVALDLSPDGSLVRETQFSKPNSENFQRFQSCSLHVSFYETEIDEEMMQMELLILVKQRKISYRL